MHKTIGLNIRNRRKKINISLRELAKQAGVTPSFISQIESGKACPSLSTLVKISNGLKTTIQNLIIEESPVINNSIVKKRERKVLMNLDHGIEMFFLIDKPADKQIEAILFKMKENAHAGSSLYRHFGYEFGFLIRGSVEITTDIAKYVLKKGDSIYLSSNIPHFLRNIHKGESEILWIVSPTNIDTQ